MHIDEVRRKADRYERLCREIDAIDQTLECPKIHAWGALTKGNKGTADFQLKMEPALIETLRYHRGLKLSQAKDTKKDLSDAGVGVGYKETP